MVDQIMPPIVEKLLANGGKNIVPYFQLPKSKEVDFRIWDMISKAEGNEKIEKWIAKFREKAGNRILDHDEPWVTLISLHGLFGNGDRASHPKRITAVNELLSDAFNQRQGNGKAPGFDSLEGLHIEVRLPEILRYREYVRGLFQNETVYHLYPDRKKALQGKVSRERASFEGNTNLDALISGKSSGRHIHVFIEAKLMSDISKDITYVPVRNQIARNVDCAIDLMTEGGQHLGGLEDFWFILLTPGMFRTENYGGPVNNPFLPFAPDRSRLYCYKMDEYLDPANLKRDLPHWQDFLGDAHWALISDHIGWLTFEDVVRKALETEILSVDDLEDYRSFFAERCMV